MVKKTLDELVAQFAENTIAQTEAIFRADPKTGNRHARKVIQAWHQLRARGDEGRNALAKLFAHARPDVRTGAAACLLKHRTKEAKKVLRDVAKNFGGFASFEASQALQRWKEGDWHLDPD